MPRKIKQKQKQKQTVHQNVKQSVIVKIGENTKKRASRRRPRKQVEEVSSLYPVIPAPVIYQMNQPPIPFASTTQREAIPVPTQFQTPVSEAFERMPEYVSLVEAIPEVSEKKPIKMKISKKIEKSMEDTVLGVGAEEFPPDASFASPEEVLKAHTVEKPEKLYIEEPPTFKSPVSGNIAFGIPENEKPIITEEQKVEKKSKKKGRPAGAKNKPKIYATPVTQELNPVSVATPLFFPHEYNK